MDNLYLRIEPSFKLVEMAAGKKELFFAIQERTFVKSVKPFYVDWRKDKETPMQFNVIDRLHTAPRL